MLSMKSKNWTIPIPKLSLEKTKNTPSQNEPDLHHTVMKFTLDSAWSFPRASSKDRALALEREPELLMDGVTSGGCGWGFALGHGFE